MSSEVQRLHSRAWLINGRKVTTRGIGAVSMIEDLESGDWKITADTHVGDPVPTLFDWGLWTIIVAERTSERDMHEASHAFIAVHPIRSRVIYSRGFDTISSEVRAWETMAARQGKSARTLGSSSIDDDCPECGSPEIELITSGAYAGYGRCSNCRWSEVGPLYPGSFMGVGFEWPDHVNVVVNVSNANRTVMTLTNGAWIARATGGTPQECEQALWEEFLHREYGQMIEP